MTWRRAILLMVIIALAVVGWRVFQRRTGGYGAGMLSVDWHGRYRGQAVLPARLAWCPVTRNGLLEAISGDTGVALVFYENDSISAGVHAAILPEQASTAPRPGATAALRFTPDTGVLVGFRSQGGSVTVQRSGGRASGTFNIRMRAMTTLDSLVMSGKFADLPVVVTAVGCG